MQPQDIRVLDPHVIDHIAAGEVVERPASVVKELLENALDAGATAVEIDLVDGGLAGISITDDGHGMSPDNARRCLLRHATSKLRSPEDLFKIATLGFRGEALSSIAAVSELTLTTRPAAALEGVILRLRGGRVEMDAAAGCPAGTTLKVRDLFFNVPARRKFMRAPATEQAHVLEAVTRVMLANRRGGVLVRNGTRRLLDIHHEATGTQRVLAALGPRVGTLYPLQAEVDGVQVDGFMSAPEIDRGDAKGLWLFVNGRYVRDRVLQRAVVDTCRELLQPGRYPTVVLHLQLSPELVDVNVHPQKLEVRFAHGAAVYRAVACALAAVVAQRPWEAAAAARSAAGRSAPVSSRPPVAAMRTPAPAGTPGPAPTRVSPPTADAPSEPTGIELLGTVLDRYFVGRSAAGLVLVDWAWLASQQALAQLQAEAQGEGVRRMTLLLPEVFDAQAPWASWLETAWEGLTRYGFELEPVAPGRYAVRAIPEALVGAAALEVALACVAAAYAGRPGASTAEHPAAQVLARCAEHLRTLPPLDVAQAALADDPLPAGVVQLGAGILERLLKSGA